MLFNTHLFIFAFLPLTLLGYWLLEKRNARLQSLWLVGANTVFYAYAGIGYLALLLAMTTITFVAGRYLLNSDLRSRQRVGLVLVLTNLLLLIFFKYANLLTTHLGADVLNIALPLGISFYTFNLVSYGLDVYRKLSPAETDYLNFLAHITFFPTILSGPLTRFSGLRQQVETRRADWELGIFMFTIGLAKKVLIADALAAQVDPLFNNPLHIGLLGSWAAVLGYAYQLYFDFSGYTDMATGIAYMLGYKLPQNFNAPYTARNITEFWQRWHITLSNWFRDYLFLPLSRSLLRRNPKNPNRVRTIGLIITMTLTGIWHGGSPTFAIWGAYHGVLLAIHAQSRVWKWKPLPVWLARGLTFLAVLMGWVIFRSDSLLTARHMLAAMFGRQGLGLEFGATSKWFLGTLVILFIVTNVQRDTWLLRPRSSWFYAVGMAVLLVLGILYAAQTTAFLYLKF